jgi:hypothetical protein
MPSESNGSTPQRPSSVQSSAPPVIDRTVLPQAVIVRAPGLLPMLYSPGELARELVIPVRTIREWLGRGLPHRRNTQGHIEIDGRQFAQWVETLRQSRVRRPLKEGEAYCFHCRQPVQLVNPTRQVRGKQVLWCAHCPNCERKIYRGGRHGE